jgi:alkyl hydroperoxide reductase subunit AhpF
MAFLTDTDATYLREKLAELLVRPVGLRLFTEPVGGLYVPGRHTCETCADAEALMKEVAALSDQIHLEIVDVSTRRDEAEQWGISYVPTIAVGPGDEDAGVRFQGMPDGYEFTSFVETLASAGSENGHGLAPETIEALAALPADVDIKTFVTPT